MEEGGNSDDVMENVLLHVVTLYISYQLMHKTVSAHGQAEYT